MIGMTERKGVSGFVLVDVKVVGIGKAAQQRWCQR
jgi:hypothetical protein